MPETRWLINGPNRLGPGLDRAPTSKLQAREKVYILLLGSIIASGGIMRPNRNLVNFSPAYAFNSTEEYSLKYQTHDTHTHIVYKLQNISFGLVNLFIFTLFGSYSFEFLPFGIKT